MRIVADASQLTQGELLEVRVASHVTQMEIVAISVDSRVVVLRCLVSRPFPWTSRDTVVGSLVAMVSNT
ncbi:hypothetical protein Bpfe_025324 [Biomphalaria pfeifferi]|uniref:Uncharacterized protein n=1 Tax=Biomphalaria pfeifferi TaxID=112525 RepID=A0AAD8B2D3_BIOPF|nr:hypothetical protein Bpfe_025324 [Biomphalaria pfeifferi]